MMNKAFWIFISFVFLSFLFVRPARAACSEKWRDLTLGTCSTGTIDCQIVTGADPAKKLLCCDTDTECKTPAPASLPGSSSGGGVKPAPCGDGAGKGIQTALGCIPTEDPNQFAAWFLKLALGIGGGIAFLLIIFGTLKIITAGGSPDGIKNGSEMITSALMGLLFILFSVFLLHLIGVDILQIPGFSK